jgi:glycosyltransferase involved in cell wall biosynthesis
MEVAVSSTVERQSKAAQVVRQALAAGMGCHLILQTMGTSASVDSIREELTKSGFDECVRLSVLEGRGLSKSRNEALLSSTAEWVLFADDDVEYLPGALHSAASALAELNDADIATFQMVFPDGSRARPYPTRVVRHTWRSILRVSSVTVAARPGRIREAGLLLDTRLGLGAEVPTGEENEWLLRCLRSGLRLRHVPLDLVKHDYTTSSSLYGYSEALNKGRLLSLMFGVWAVPLCLGFALRHRKRFHGGGFARFLSALLAGATDNRWRRVNGSVPAWRN